LQLGQIISDSLLFFILSCLGFLIPITSTGNK
jgi:hypothetical protein